MRKNDNDPLILSPPERDNISSHVSDAKRVSDGTTNHQLKNSDNKIRWFLAIWAALLTLLVLVVFIITRDAVVLLGSTTVTGIAVTYVYGFYFR